MAQAKQTSRLFAAATGALLSVAAALNPSASFAQEATPVAQPSDTVWTDELRALDEADLAATEYAKNNNGVGILLHVGEDFPNEYFNSAEEAAQAFVAIFQQQHGTSAQYFMSPNPGSEWTGVTYHIGDQIHGTNAGTEVKTVLEAYEAMPDVVKQLQLIKEIASDQTNKPIEPSQG